MDKNFRRALYIALVAGGLVVVDASSAYAAEEGLLDPVTQGVTDGVEGAAAAGSALDAVVADAPQPGKGVDATAGDGPAEGAPNLDDDFADDAALLGVLGSLARADVTWVVDGTQGAESLVDDLLEGVLPTDIEVPGPDQPGPDQLGTDQPGTGEPGAGEPGAGEPGTDPGVVEPGTDGPGAGSPGSGGPGADRPGANGPGFQTRGGETRGVAMTGRTGAAAVGAPGYTTAGYDTAAVPDSDDPADAGESADGPDADQDLPVGGVDLSWGDKADVVPAAYDGTILPGGFSDGLRGTLTGLDGQAAPVVVPGETLAQTGPLITGQLALVSLLLGLGLAVLRTRRRRIVVSSRIDG
ncbi:hypothetical protein [Promicromonospora soli]|uniref:LPXTG-motif cell wall-anchored protein n=1 Tax=Promicromonospora soli TaxID=2035533 RepID=A0A919KSV5_9MICO|nr:hypothetical protein [Promicromonospora soli]GHH71334.1 hypothetical protein GCM10017772_19590 [Promicromonospora soli]